MAWFAFVPILRFVRGRGFLPAFAAGLMSVFLAAYLSTTGIAYASRSDHGLTSWVYTGFGIFGFSVCLAIGAWGDKGSKNLPVWWFAGLAVLLEAYLLVQLPAHLALTQYRNPLMLQVASLGGIWMVSFILWWANFYLATLRTPQFWIAALIIVLVAFSGSHLHFPASGPFQKIAVVQIAEPEEDELRKLHAQASVTHPRFVIWPEFGGIPFVRKGEPSGLIRLSAEPGTSPILTSFPDRHEPMPHNTAALFSNGRMSNVYWKRKLFGAENKMHDPGSQPVAVSYSGGTVGLNVCYDSCYPEVIRDTAKLPNVNFLALPSIDPSATNNFVSAIHASYTPFRAAENGVAMVKADGYAYSTFVDSFGQIIKQLGPGDQTDTEEVPVGTLWTPYKQFGDWFLYLIGFLVVGRLGIEARHAFRTKRRNAKPSR